MSENKYEAFIQSQNAQRTVAADATLSVVRKRNPDVVADGQRLGVKYGFPAPLSEVAIGELQEREKREGIAALIKADPKLSGWLSNERNASLAHDDVEKLSGVSQEVERSRYRERNAKAKTGSWLERQLFGDDGALGHTLEFTGKRAQAAASGAVQGLGMASSGAGRAYQAVGETMSEALYGAVDFLLGEESAQSLRDAAAIDYNTARYVDPGVSAENIGGRVKGAAQAIDIADEDKDFTTDVSSAIGQMGFQIAATLLTGGQASTGLLFAQGVDVQADQLIEEDVSLQDPEARAALLAGGVVTAVTERIGLERVLKRLPEGLRNKAQGMLWGAFKAGGTEALTEMAEGILQKTITYATASVDEDLPSYIMRGAGYEGAVAGTAGGITNILLNLALPGRRKVAQQGADEARQRLDALHEAAKNSALKARSPEAFKDAVRTMQGEQEGTHIYVPAQVFAEHFQSGEEGPADVAEAMGIGRTEYEQAAAAGTDMAIPVESYLAYVDDAGHEALADHARFDPSGMSLAELASGEVEAQVEQLQKDMEAKLRALETADATMNDVTAQARAIMTDAGLPQSEAEPLSLMMGAMINTMAGRTGVTAEEFVRHIGGLPGVRMAPPEVASALRADEFDALVEKIKAEPETEAADVQDGPDPSGQRALKEYLDNLGINYREMTGQEVRIQVAEMQGAELDRGGSELEQPAFHGSPHTFDKFSTDNIGTGEGAQAYGWGLYFTSKEEIARHYRDALTQDRLVTPDGNEFNIATIGGWEEFSDNFLSPMADAAPAMPTHSDSFGRNSYEGLLDDAYMAVDEHDTMAETLRDMSEWLRNDGIDAAIDRIEGIPGIDASIPAVLRKQYEMAARLVDDIADGKLDNVKGRLYSVELAPSEDDYLLWDETLENQSEKVQRALGWTPEDVAEWRKVRKDDTDALLEALQGDAEYTEQRFDNKGRPSMTATGAEIIGGDKLFKSPEAAKSKSLDLLSKGIRGVKYLDGASRSRGEGDYNYVIFSDDDVQITEMYQSAMPPAPESDAFKKWFGDSKVVDEKGDPRVVYHGTNADFEAFDPDKVGDAYGTDDQGFFFTSSDEQAEIWADRAPNSANPKVMPVYLSLQNPWVIEAPDGRGPVDYFESGEGVFDRGHRAAVDYGVSSGYDGMIVVGDDESMYIAFSPEQIKSVHNRGTFDPSDPSILNQAATEKPRGSIVLPRGGITQGRTIINLFEGRDLSTALHEMSHYFLEVLRVSAGMPGATPEVADMWAKTQAALGIDNLTDGSPIPVAAHEQWAEMGERYFGGGQAPSIELQSSFERFRAWMLQVWAYAKRVMGAKINEKVSPELRSVLDRMLATERQIAEQAQANDTHRAFDSADAAGMSPEEWSAYASQDSRSMAEATRRAQAAVVEEWEARKSKLQRKARQKAKEQATKKVAEDQLVQAVEVLTNGRRIGGENDNDDDDLSSLKIDRQALIDMGYGDNLNTRANAAAGNDLFPRGKGVIYSATDGSHPDAVAPIFGYETGAELVDDLLIAPKPAQAIEIETDRIMKQQFGDLLNDGSVTLEIIEGLHSGERAKLLEMELNAIYRKAPVRATETKSPGRKIVREVARRMMVDMNIGKARRADIFLAAERRAGREAVRFVAKGEFVEAREAKQRQLINFFLWSEANKLRKQQVKDQALIKKITQPEDKSGKGRDIDLVRAARVVLSRFGLASEPRGYSFADWVEDLRQNDPQMLDEVGRAVAVATSATVAPKDMTVSQYNGMMDAVRSLMAAARNRRKVELAGEWMDIDDARDIIIERLSQAYPKDYLSNRGEGLKAGMKDFMLSMGAAVRRVQAWSRFADGEDNGPIFRLVVLPVMDGIDAYRDRKEAVLKNALDILKPSLSDAYKGGAITAPELDGFRFQDKGEIITALLNTGNEGNEAALLEGYKWTPEGFAAFVKRLISEGTLTKADFDTVQAIWDLFESLRPPAQAAHRRIYGHYFDRVPARALQTPFGTYRGGYFPLSYDKSKSAIGQNVDANRLFDEQQSSAMFPTTGKGFTIKRSNVTAPVDLSLRMIPSHIDKVLRFTYIQPEVRSVARVLSGHEFKNDVFTMDPEMIPGMLIPWLQRSASQQVETRTLDRSVGWFDPVMRFGRRSAGATTMVLNYVNALQQFTGFAPALTRVRAGSMARGMATYYTRPGRTTQFVYSRSPFMRRRVGVDAQEVMNDLSKLLSKPSIMGDIREFTINKGYFLQRIADRMVAQPIWLAAYNEATERGSTEKEAVAHADGVVRDTQSSFNAEDVSAIEVGSPYKRAFTMFLNYFNSQYNLGITEAGNAVKSKGLTKAIPRLIGVYAAVVLMPAVIADGIGAVFRGGFDDEDDDGYADDAAYFVLDAQVRYMLAMLPFVGQAANAIWGATDDKAYNDRVSLTPVVMIPEKLAQAGKSVAKQIRDGDNEAHTVKDTLTALMMVFGLGGGNAIGKAAGYGTGVATGEYDGSTLEEIVRGVSTGREER